MVAALKRPLRVLFIEEYLPQEMLGIMWLSRAIKDAVPELVFLNCCHLGAFGSAQVLGGGVPFRVSHRDARRTARVGANKARDRTIPPFVLAETRFASDRRAVELTLCLLKMPRL